MENSAPFLIALLLVSGLLVPSHVFSQTAETGPKLSVQLTGQTPFVYQNEEGKTVVIGEIANLGEVAHVTDVVIRVNFYNDVDPEPVDVKRGNSLLDVIPPQSTSPFIIESNVADSEISQVSVSVEGFKSSSEKKRVLELRSGESRYGDTFMFSGSITNSAGADAGKTKVHLVFYDVFIPPRIIKVSTINIDNIPATKSHSFTMETDLPRLAKNFVVLAESEFFISDRHIVKLPEVASYTKLVAISDVAVTNEFGKRLSQVKVGEPVSITSNLWIQFSADQKSDTLPFVYYAQIKKSGEIPFVEFLGKHEDVFLGAEKKNPSITWTPEEKGMYFIETFVWDENAVPIANKGPVLLVVVT